MKRSIKQISKMFFSKKTAAISLFALASQAQALTFTLPSNGNVVGKLQHTVVSHGESLSAIGRRFNIGGYEMMEANPGVRFSYVPPGTRLVVPSQFILPDGPRKGIVINLAEMRLYYYHPDNIHVSTYPAGVGQSGWDTPLGKTTVVRKRAKPTWIVPDSILANHLRHGVVISRVRPPGPDNPLGDYALSLGMKSIVIHGTPEPQGVGIRGSHGCIRMLNEDVGELYRIVEVGTPVSIIHQPHKVGVIDNHIVMESHESISAALERADHRDLQTLIKNAAAKVGKKLEVKWDKVERLKSHTSGYPERIGQLF